MEFLVASPVLKSEGAIFRMHLVSYDFGPLKVLSKGDIGVNVSNHPKQDYLRKGRSVRKKKRREENLVPERKRKAKKTEEENFAVV